MKKIILCTTFRDFTGSSNDDIQKKFLTSIEDQSYKDFEVVVTLFGEKNVRNELNKYSFMTSFYDGSTGDYRYTLSDVINNAIDYAFEEYNDFILLWTTCDVIFEVDFFKNVVLAMEKSEVGTSHPHLSYSSIEDYSLTRNINFGELFSGFDLIFFSSRFIDLRIRELLKDFKFYDWGVFEHFLISLAELKSRRGQKVKLINIFESSKIIKIENDRVLTNEPNSFLIKSHQRNSVTFTEYLRLNKLPLIYFDLVFCHLKFQIDKNSIKHFFRYKRDLLNYLFRRLMRLVRHFIVRKSKLFF